MRITSRRLILGVILAGVVAAAGAAAASADGGTPQAWASTGPLGPPLPQSGETYVSTVTGQEQARAFVRIPSGSTSLRLVEASDGVQPANATLEACPLAGPVEGNGRVTTAPMADCTVNTSLKRETSGTWNADLGPITAELTGSNDGWIAVVPSQGDATTTYTVAFDTTKTAVTSAPSTSTSSPPAQPDAAGPVGTFESPPTSFGVVPLPPALSNPDALTPPHHERAPPRIIAPAPARHHATYLSPGLLALVAAIAAGAMVARSRWLPTPVFPNTRVRTSSVTSTAVAAVLYLAVARSSEAAVYKFGVVGIVFIGAIGLHLLVNWAGELSLAHAAFIGLPAFLVAQLADHTRWTPITFIPVGVAIGAALGLVVAIPARRARGLQVALVTLAIGIAITQFFFTRSWIVGPSGGLSIPEPSLFGIHFRTSRSLLPVLAAIVLLAAYTAQALLNSSIGRALAQVRTVPDAAATTGVPVSAYRGLAYALAGAYAGLAGGAYVVWVQRVDVHAFPLNLSFTYLVIATLAGPGGLVGLAVAVVALQGAQLFSVIPDSVGLYLGPIALIVNVTRYQAGINGAVRDLTVRVRERSSLKMRSHSKQTAVRLPVIVAGVVMAIGFGAIALAWYNAGNTDQIWIQNQELLSGGVGGGALVVLGGALLIRDALLHGAAAADRDD